MLAFGIVLIKDAIGSDPENRKGARSYDTVANQSAMHAVLQQTTASDYARYERIVTRLWNATA